LNINFSLKVGSASEHIEVVANQSTGLETEDHDVNATMEAETMENLPEQSGYRNATFYAQTTQAGVEPGSTLGYSNINSNVSQYNQQSNQLFIAGQGFWSSSYLLDGVIDMSYFDQTATVKHACGCNTAGRDHSQQRERPLRRRQYAERDHQSGTETIHGSAYDYVQNNQMNARGWSAGPLGELRYNLFGADAGWKIPFTKDKLFSMSLMKAFAKLQLPFSRPTCLRRRSAVATSAQIWLAALYHRSLQPSSMTPLPTPQTARPEAVPVQMFSRRSATTAIRT